MKKRILRKIILKGVLNFGRCCTKYDNDDIINLNDIEEQVGPGIDQYS